MITTEGANKIIRYLCGQERSFAAAISLGIGSTAAAVSDKSLEFEYLRLPVESVTGDLTNQKIIFKTTIPILNAGTFYEIGTWSSIGNPKLGIFDSKMISSFDEDFETWAGGTMKSLTNRIGTTELELTAVDAATDTATLTVGLDMSGFNGSDKLLLAVNVVANAGTAFIRFQTDVSNYLEYTFSGLATGYQIISFDPTLLVPTGSPDSNNITSILVGVTGSGGTMTVRFDGLRVDNLGLDTDNVLISRSIIASPIAKLGDREAEIEYHLDLSIT